MSHSPDLMKPLRSLVEMGEREELEMRPVLLRVLTDLFVSRPSHSFAEIKQFEAITLGLIDFAGDRTRLTMAGKLARFGATPASVVERLMRDGGDAAAEFLAHSSLIDRAALLRAALAGDPRQAAAVAARADLDDEIALILARRAEAEVTRALVNNFAAPIGEEVADQLIARRPRDPETARVLCGRLTAPARLAALFLHASQSQRAEVILAARRQHLAAPSRAPRGFTDSNIGAEIERAAADGDRALLAAIVASGLGAGISDTESIFDDPFGEPLALSLAAMNVSAETAARVFMLLDPQIAHSVDRVRALCRLVEAVSPATARAIVDAMIPTRDAPRRRVHAPVADPTAAATPSRDGTMAREEQAPQRRGLLLFRQRG